MAGGLLPLAHMREGLCQVDTVNNSPVIQGRIIHRVGNLTDYTWQDALTFNAFLCDWPCKQTISQCHSHLSELPALQRCLRLVLHRLFGWLYQNEQVHWSMFHFRGTPKDLPGNWDQRLKCSKFVEKTHSHPKGRMIGHVRRLGWTPAMVLSQYSIWQLYLSIWTSP